MPEAPRQSNAGPVTPEAAAVNQADFHLNKLASTIRTMRTALTLQEQAVNTLLADLHNVESLAELARVRLVLEECSRFQLAHISALQTDATTPQKRETAALPDITAPAQSPVQTATPAAEIQASTTADIPTPAATTTSTFVARTEVQKSSIDRDKQYEVAIDGTEITLTGLHIELIATIRNQGDMSLEQLASKVGLTGKGARVRKIIEGMRKKFRNGGLDYNGLHISTTGQVSLGSEIVSDTDLPFYPARTTQKPAPQKAPEHHTGAASPVIGTSPERTSRTDTFVSNLTAQERAKVERFLIADLVKRHKITPEQGWSILAEIFNKPDHFRDAFIRPGYFSFSSLQAQWKTKLLQRLTASE